LAKSLQNGKIKKYKKWQDKIKWQIFLNGKIIKYWQKKAEPSVSSFASLRYFRRKAKKTYM